MLYLILNYYRKIFIILIIIFSSKSVFSEQVTDADAFIKMLISQQLLFNDCREKYPQQMQKNYENETNVFEALDKDGQYDKNFKATVDMIFIHLDPEKKQTLTQAVMSDIQQFKKEQKGSCAMFLTKKKYINLKLNEIVYDPKTMLFYLNINQHWLQAKLTSDALSCDCDGKYKNLEIVRQFAIKNRNKILKSDHLYMQQREDGVNEASIMMMWGDNTPSELNEQSDANKRIIDDFGFESIVPIQKEIQPSHLITFSEGEYDVGYECKVDYVDEENTTCLKELIK